MREMRRMETLAEKTHQSMSVPACAINLFFVGREGEAGGRTFMPAQDKVHTPGVMSNRKQVDISSLHKSSV
jgi:hypothetical protein